MPLIHVYHERDSLTPAQRDELGERLTSVVIEIEGGPGIDGPKPRSIAWVMFHDVDGYGWYIGGHSDETYVSPPGKFLVNIFVPEGALSKARKAMVHRAVDAAFFDVLGGDAADERWPSIFAHIHEWAEGNIGILGQSHGLADVARYAGSGNAETRAHGQKHMQARAGWRATAGFPD